MPIRYFYDPIFRLLVTKYSGHTSAELHTVFANSLAGRIIPGEELFLLHDLSDWTDTGLNGRHLSQRTTAWDMKMAQTPTPTRQAIFAPTSSGYAIARMYWGFAASVRHLDLEIFDEAEAAVRWLKLPGPAAQYLKRNDWIEVPEP